MPLNHTIRLINSDYKSALQDLISAGINADCVVMNPVKEYLKGDNYVESIKELAQLLILATYNNTHLFCVVNERNITDTLQGMTQGGYNLRGILTIPILTPSTTNCTLPNRTQFENKNTLQVLHMTAGRGSFLRVTDLVNGEEGSVYPTNWSSWFKGSLTDAYRAMIKISTDHSDVVLDPFMMTGDVGVACIEQDRRYLGIEQEGFLYRFAKNRLDLVGE